MKGRKRNAQSPNRRPFVPAECREQAKKEWTSIKKYSIISPDEACQIVQTPQPRAAPNVSANPLGSNSKSHAPLRHAHPVGAELEESRSMTPKGLASRRTSARRAAPLWARPGFGSIGGFAVPPPLPRGGAPVRALGRRGSPQTQRTVPCVFAMWIAWNLLEETR